MAGDRSWQLLPPINPDSDSKGFMMPEVSLTVVPNYRVSDAIVAYRCASLGHKQGGKAKRSQCSCGLRTEILWIFAHSQLRGRLFKSRARVKGYDGVSCWRESCVYFNSRPLRPVTGTYFRSQTDG